MSATQSKAAAEREAGAAAIELALDLLRRIGEDCLIRPSYRVVARQHFRKLSRLATEERRKGDWQE